MKPWTHIVAAGTLAVCLWPPTAEAQTLEQRIAAIRQKEKANQAAKDKLAASRISLQFGVINKGKMTAKDALEYLALVSDLPILVNWKQLELAGIDPNTEVELIGRNLTLGAAIKLVMKQMVTDQPLILEPTPHYVQIITKQQANKDRIIRVYPIGDLLAKVPNFNDAPEFDLDSVISGDPTGGGGGASPFDDAGGGLDAGPTEEEQAQKIIELIQTTVEPEIWAEGSSISYWNKSLVVSAPAYVQRQIGGGGGQLTTHPGAPRADVGVAGPAGKRGTNKVNLDGVAGIAEDATTPATRRSPTQRQKFNQLFNMTKGRAATRR